MNPLTDPILVTSFYGALTAIAVCMAWRSNLTPLRHIALLMGVEWLGSNLIYHTFGREHAPWLTPSFDVLICIFMAKVAIDHRSQQAWEVVRLFVLEFLIVVAAFLTHQQGTPFYFAALNAVFVCQLFVGGRAAHVELVHRARRIDQRLDRWTASGARS